MMWMHKSVEIIVMAARSSNHNPILITFHKKTAGCHGRKNCFKFEASWTLDTECSEIINEAWKDRNSREGAMKTVRRNLEKCQFRLKG